MAHWSRRLRPQAPRRRWRPGLEAAVREREIARPPRRREDRATRRAETSRCARRPLPPTADRAPRHHPAMYKYRARARRRDAALGSYLRGRGRPTSAIGDLDDRLASEFGGWCRARRSTLATAAGATRRRRPRTVEDAHVRERDAFVELRVRRACRSKSLTSCTRAPARPRRPVARPQAPRVKLAAAPVARRRAPAPLDLLPCSRATRRRAARMTRRQTRRPDGLPEVHLLRAQAPAGSYLSSAGTAGSLAAGSRSRRLPQDRRLDAANRDPSPKRPDGAAFFEPGGFRRPRARAPPSRAASAFSARRRRLRCDVAACPRDGPRPCPGRRSAAGRGRRGATAPPSRRRRRLVITIGCFEAHYEARRRTPCRRRLDRAARPSARPRPPARPSGRRIRRVRHARASASLAAKRRCNADAALRAGRHRCAPTDAARVAWGRTRRRTSCATPRLEPSPRAPPLPGEALGVRATCTSRSRRPGPRRIAEMTDAALAPFAARSPARRASRGLRGRAARARDAARLRAARGPACACRASAPPPEGAARPTRRRGDAWRPRSPSASRLRVRARPPRARARASARELAARFRRDGARPLVGAGARHAGRRRRAPQRRRDRARSRGAPAAPAVALCKALARQRQRSRYRRQRVGHTARQKRVHLRSSRAARARQTRPRRASMHHGVRAAAMAVRGGLKPLLVVAPFAAVVALASASR